MRRSAILFLSATCLAPPLIAQTVHSASVGENIRSATGSAPTDREQTADQQVLQVLNRPAFGPRPGDAATVRRIGVDAWIDQQLHPERIDDSGMDQLLGHYEFPQSEPERSGARIRGLRAEPLEPRGGWRSKIRQTS